MMERHISCSFGMENYLFKIQQLSLSHLLRYEWLTAARSPAAL